MNLEVGQYYRVTSAVAEGYEQIHGPFSFVIKIYELSRATGTPLTPVSGDLTLILVDWEPMNGWRDDPWFAAYSMAIGNTKYGEMCMKVPPEKVHEVNWSPDLINGSGRWYVPDLFRWQHLFLYLVRHDAVEWLEHYTVPEHDFSMK